jgi:hypothetical protein
MGLPPPRSRPCTCFRFRRFSPPPAPQKHQGPRRGNPPPYRLCIQISRQRRQNGKDCPAFPAALAFSGACRSARVRFG